MQTLFIFRFWGNKIIFMVIKNNRTDNRSEQELQNDREVGERISTLRKDFKETQAQLAEAISVNTQTVSFYESGRLHVKDKRLEVIAKRYGTNELYLKTGNEDYFGVGVEEIIGGNTINIYGTIFAGNPQGAEQDLIGTLPVKQSLIKKYGLKKLKALKIVGDSMNKVVPSGSIGVFTTDYEPIENGQIYGVMINNSEVTLKRVYVYDDEIRFEPDSFNPEHESWSYSKVDSVEVTYFGKLVYSEIEF